MWAFVGKAMHLLVKSCKLCCIGRLFTYRLPVKREDRGQTREDRGQIVALTELVSLKTFGQRRKREPEE